jgi:hypothetical protein
MSDGRHIMSKDRPAEWKKAYLGDGVYAAFDGFGIWLTAEDGIIATDAIYVEPAVLDSLLRFYRSIGKEKG